MVKKLPRAPFPDPISPQKLGEFPSGRKPDTREKLCSFEVWHGRCFTVLAEQMNSLETSNLEPLVVRSENIVHLPLGLLGFEHIKKYVLLANPEEAPFLWLQVLDDPTLAFLVIPPNEVLSDYQPEITDEDSEFIGLKSPQDALVYNIVTLRPGRATMNLKGPIVLNRYTLMGKQIVISNAAQYALQHPLPVASQSES